MPKRAWPERIGAWLPEQAERDYYRPALADLHGDRLRRRMSRARYFFSVMLVFFECLRLAAMDCAAGVAAVRRPAHERRRKDRLMMFVRDLKHALRIFWREPAFAAAAVVTLTLGIGANTALFAVVEAVLLRPLPFAAAEDLVIVRHRDAASGITKQDIAIGDFIDMRQRQQSFESMAGYGGFQSTLVGGGDPVRVEGTVVTPDVMVALRVPVAMGRGFNADDVKEGASPVVIVSHDLWQTELGSDPQILSRSVQLGPTRRLVVGILPQGFRFPPAEQTDVLLPLRVPDAPPANRKAGWTYVIARLKPGVTLERAASELTSLSQQMASDHPQQNAGTQYYALSLRDALVGDTKTPLLLLLAAVGFVLLIACANVGNLLLARSLSRQQELAMRLALGASRGRLVLQILTEGLVLAFAGGAAGIAIAWVAAPALAALVPQQTPIPGLDAVGFNGWIVAFAFVASLLSAVVFSAVACFALTREAGRGALTGQRRVTMTAGARRAASSLVAAEIALAVVLLMAAGLTLRSFGNMISVDPGFTSRNVLTLQFALPAGRYPDPLARRAVYDRAFAALEALPEVETVGAAVVTPLTGNNWTVPMARPEHPLPAGQRPPDVGWQAASGGYFRALNIPLRSGRLFDARDVPKGAPVVLVSEALAARFFPGEQAVGKRVQLGDGTAEIVGVVGNIRRAALTDVPREDMYFPFEQQPAPGITLFIRTTGDPIAALAAVRTTVREVERGAVLYETRTLDDVVAASAAIARLAMRLLGGFAIVALALAAIGIYGVMSYSVRRRTRELGTRVALGASRADIVRLVMRQAATIAGIGLAIGTVTGLLAARTLSSLLFGVPPWDPWALAAAATLLTATALGASYLPARRAARVDPACTLATE